MISWFFAQITGWKESWIGSCSRERKVKEERKTHQDKEITLTSIGTHQKIDYVLLALK